MGSFEKLGNMAIAWFIVEYTISPPFNMKVQRGTYFTGMTCIKSEGGIFINVNLGTN